MKKTREELEKQCAEAKVKVEQYQHRGQRYENRIRYYTQGERKKRNHRLITRGGAVESIVPEVRGMSERAFFLLMEKVFSLYGIHGLLDLLTDQLGQGVQQNILPQEFVGTAAFIQHCGIIGAHIVIGHLFPFDDLLVPHHRPAAVAAVYQTPENIFALAQVIVLPQPGVIFPVFRFTEGLYSVKVLLADDGLVGILHDGPLLSWQKPVRSPGIKFRAAAALDQVAQVDPAAQDFLDSLNIPGLPSQFPLWYQHSVCQLCSDS